MEFPPDIGGKGRPMHPDFQAWIVHERDRFNKAEQICLDCPVFVQCGKNATDDDKQWSMRAAELPIMYLKASKAPQHTCTHAKHPFASLMQNFHCAYCYRYIVEKDKHNERRRVARAANRAQRDKENAARSARRVVVN